MEAHDWDARYAGQELVWGVAPNRFVEDRCGHLPSGRALDLACGEGRNALWLAARGWQVVAVDFAAVAVDRARSIARHQGLEVDLRVADLRDFVPERGAFDLVLLSYLQVPAADREVIWPRAAAAVAAGGTFLLVGHDARNLAEGYGGPQDPAVLYRAGDVVPLLGDLVVDEAAEVTRPAPDGRVAIDCLVRAHRRP